MTRVFSVPSFRFGLTPKVGAWNRLASFGRKVKDGEEVEFSVETFREMIENWKQRGYKLAMCLDHESASSGRAPAAAFFDALAVFSDGQCVKFASVDGETEKPEAEGREGLYGRLAEITPLGKSETEGLANYAGISPFFTTDGRSEDGKPIGYEIFDVAAVNVPFQSGCALQFYREKFTGAPSAFGGVMDEEKMKRLGLAEGSTPEEMSAAFAKYMDETDAKIAAQLPEPAKMQKDDDEDEDDKKFEKEDEKEAFATLAKKFGLGSSSRREILMAAAALPGPSAIEAQINQLVDARFAAERAQVEAGNAKARAELLAAEAVQGGYAETDKPALIAFAQSNYDAAEKLAAPYLSRSRALFGRLTHGGAPIGQKATPQLAPSESPNGVVKMGRGLAQAIKMYRKDHPSASYEAAAAEVTREHPELANSYFNGQ